MIRVEPYGYVTLSGIGRCKVFCELRTIGDPQVFQTRRVVEMPDGRRCPTDWETHHYHLEEEPKTWGKDFDEGNPYCGIACLTPAVSRSARESAKRLGIKIDEKAGQEQIDVITGKRFADE